MRVESLREQVLEANLELVRQSASLGNNSDHLGVIGGLSVHEDDDARNHGVASFELPRPHLLMLGGFAR